MVSLITKIKNRPIHRAERRSMVTDTREKRSVDPRTRGRRYMDLGPRRRDSVTANWFLFGVMDKVLKLDAFKMAIVYLS